jgi:hypothetical protein
VIYKISASREVVRKGHEASGKRRRTIRTPEGPRTLVFGASPVYLVCDELPTEIAEDAHLLVTPVDDVEPGGETIDLKGERVQASPPDPAAASAAAALRIAAAGVQLGLQSAATAAAALASKKRKR